MSQLPPTSPTASQLSAGVASEAIRKPPERVTEGASSADIETQPIETQPIIRHFSRAVENAATFDVLLKSIFNIIDAETDCLALWRVQTNADKSPQVFCISDDTADALWQTFESVNLPVIQKAQEFDQICSSPLPDQKHIIVASPLVNSTGQAAASSTTPASGSSEILAGCFVLKDQSALRLQWLMGIASQSVNQWLLRCQAQTAQSETRSLNEALSLVHCVNDSNNVTDAAIGIVNRLRRLFNADQTALAQVDSQNKVKLLAVSDLEKPDQNAVSNRLLQSAISQVLTAESTVSFPSLDPGVSAAQVLPLENWCNAANAARAINLPMKLDDGKIVGMLLVTFGKTDNDPLKRWVSRRTWRTWRRWSPNPSIPSVGSRVRRSKDGSQN